MYIDSYAEVDKVLLKKFSQTLYAVADDAYLDVQFNPDYVKESQVWVFNKVGAIKDKDAIIEMVVKMAPHIRLVAFESVPKLNVELAMAEDKVTEPVNFS